jgi:transposase
MTPYSQDLRQRIVDSVVCGDETLAEVADRFLVSISFVTRLLQLYRRTGSVEPRPHGGGNPARLGPEDLERLREFIRQRPDATLEECRRHLGASCSTMTISRALSRLGLPRKKEVPRAAEQGAPEHREQRRAFCEGFAAIDPRRLVFVDECGADTAMARDYGRAPAGERVYTDTPGHWDSATLTCGMRLSGAMAALAFAGATDTAMFETYVEEVLVPELRPGDVVIWDNVKPHQSEEAIEAVEAAGARVVPLPPYSPDLTPIEEMFSKVKGAMKSAAARTKQAVYATFASALHDVTLEDIAGWFHDRAAYAMQL